MDSFLRSKNKKLLNKKAITYLLIGFALFMIIAPMPVTALSNNIVFTIDKTTYSVSGSSLTMEVTPFIESGRTYIPVKYLANSLGITNDGIQWNAKLQQVTLSKGTDTLILNIGSPSMSFNGKTSLMDSKPLIRNGRTFLPAKYVAEAFGFTVSWDASAKAVTVSPKTAVGKTYTVDIKNFAFGPETLTIQKGDTIVWTNQDQVRHSVVFDSFSSPPLSQRDTYSHTFDQTGTFNYHCSPHTYMTGSIVVK